MTNAEPTPVHVSEPNLLAREAPHQGHWLTVIDKMIDKNISAELLGKVFEMQQTWEKEQQRKSFVAAFAKFKAEAPSAIARTGKVGFTSNGKTVGYQHVELDVACAALIPTLSKHGLAHSWETQQAESGQITVTCHIDHCDGHRKSVTLRGLPDASGSKNAIQAVGSAVYYLERYTLLAALGIAQGGDDDGRPQAATDRPSQAEMELLGALLEDTGHVAGSEKLERFKKWLQIEKIDDITPALMPKAIEQLQRIKAKPADQPKTESPKQEAKAEPPPAKKAQTDEPAVPEPGRVIKAWISGIEKCATVESLQEFGAKFTATTSCKGKPFAWTQAEIEYFGFFFDAQMAKLKRPS